MSNNFLILGDPHIGAGSNLSKTIGNSNTRINDQVNLLNWTLLEAISNDCNRIIITGDVFDDPKPNHDIISIFIKFIKECVDNDISIDIIMGNHDFLRTGNNYYSPLDIISNLDLDNVTVHNSFTTVFIENNTAITFMPFRDRKSLSCDSNKEAIDKLFYIMNYETASIPDFCTKIAIGHFAIEGSIYVGNELDDIANELFCPISLFKNYDHVWMGHIHEYQELEKNIFHIGSMDLSSFNENPNKNIVIFNTENKSFFTKKIPVKTLSKLTIEVPDGQNANEYVKSFLSNKSLKNTIVKIDVVTKNKDPLNKKEIESLLLNSGAIISNIHESKKITSEIKKTNISNKLDVKESIKLYADLLQEDKRADFIELANEILKELK